MPVSHKRHVGFTLIEVLIVIGIIAVLAAIVLIAVSPQRQFAQANNAQRSANVNAILNAIGQYIVDNKGDISGLDITTSLQEISTAGADICDELVPKYISALPADPTKPDQSIVEGECDSYALGYSVERDSGNRITVSAPSAEAIDGDTVTIEVTR